MKLSEDRASGGDREPHCPSGGDREGPSGGRSGRKESQNKLRRSSHTGSVRASAPQRADEDRRRSATEPPRRRRRRGGRRARGRSA